MSKLCEHCMEYQIPDCGSAFCGCEGRIAKLQAENADANREAVSLAMWLFDRYYADKGPQLVLCDTTAGILSQVDNMLAGLAQQHEALRQALTSITEMLDAYGVEHARGIARAALNSGEKSDE